MTNLDLTFGETILIPRRRKGWTANEASALVGVSNNTFCSWEVGKTLPKRKMIKKIAEVLECPVGYLGALIAKEGD